MRFLKTTSSVVSNSITCLVRLERCAVFTVISFPHMIVPGFLHCCWYLRLVPAPRQCSSFEDLGISAWDFQFVTLFSSSLFVAQSSWSPVCEWSREALAPHHGDQPACDESSLSHVARIASLAAPVPASFGAPVPESCIETECPVTLVTLLQFWTYSCPLKRPQFPYTFCNF